ncbi:MAG: hypothetical protein PVJ67_00635 [Candidatus Pacearchaeota archaeon]|jgi:hypothetical protein
MENINIKKSDFNKLLATVEILISDVEEMRSQKEITEKRIKDIRMGKVQGKTEEDYNEYLKRRGITC